MIETHFIALFAAVLAFASFQPVDSQSGCSTPPVRGNPSDYDFRSSLLQVFPSITVGCTGCITRWSYISRNGNGTGLYLAAFRPVPSKPNLYQQVGATPINNFNVPVNTWVNYNATTPIPVKPGDVLGLYYQSAQGLWPYSGHVPVTSPFATPSGGLAAYNGNALISNVDATTIGNNVDVNGNPVVDMSNAAKVVRIPAIQAYIDPNCARTTTTSTTTTATATTSGSTTPEFTTQTIPPRRTTRRRRSTTPYTIPSTTTTALLPCDYDAVITTLSPCVYDLPTTKTTTTTTTTKAKTTATTTTTTAPCKVTTTAVPCQVLTTTTAPIATPLCESNVIMESVPAPAAKPSILTTLMATSPPAVPKNPRRCLSPFRTQGQCNYNSVTLRWFFDTSTQLCEIFWHYDCVSSQNIFISRDTCEYHCGQLISGNLSPDDVNNSPVIVQGTNEMIATYDEISGPIKASLKPAQSTNNNLKKNKPQRRN